MKTASFTVDWWLSAADRDRLSGPYLLLSALRCKDKKGDFLVVATVRQILAPTDRSEPLSAIWRTLWRTLWRTKDDIWLLCTKKAANTDRSNASA